MLAALPLLLTVSTGGVVEVEDLPVLNRVVLRELTGEALPSAQRVVLTNALSLELKKLKGLDVITMDELRTLFEIEVERQVTGCEDDSCLAELADTLGADGWISGSVGAIGDQRVLTLQRFDAKRAKVTHRTQKRIELTDGNELLALVGPAVVELFPERELRTGVTRGVDPVVVLVRPPVPATVTSGVLLAGGASALIAGGLGLAFGLEYARADELARQSATVDVSGRILQQQYESSVPLAIGAQVAGGVAIALLLTGAVLTPFTDFSEDG